MCFASLSCKLNIDHKQGIHRRDLYLWRTWSVRSRGLGYMMLKLFSQDWLELTLDWISLRTTDPCTHFYLIQVASVAAAERQMESFWNRVGLFPVMFPSFVLMKEWTDPEVRPMSYFRRFLIFSHLFVGLWLWI